MHRRASSAVSRLDEGMQENTYSIHHVMDVTGLFCPEPVMMLHNKMHDLAVGEVLEVRATDPSTTRDIPKFCHFLGHELLLQEERDQLFFYHIRKCAGDS